MTDIVIVYQRYCVGEFVGLNAESMNRPDPKSAERTLRITPEMIEAGARIVRHWEEGDEPDARVLVRELLSEVLGGRASFD